MVAASPAFNRRDLGMIHSSRFSRPVNSQIDTDAMVFVDESLDINGTQNKLGAID